MAKELSNDPPAYYQLDMPTQVLHESKEESTFENEKTLHLFILKVLSIFTMQIIAIGSLIMLYVISGLWSVSTFSKTPFFICCIIIYIVVKGLIVYYEQTRRRSPYNVIILVYHPVLVALIISTMMDADSFVSPMMVITFFDVWKNYLFSTLAVLFYTILTLESEHEFRIRNCVYIATAVFFVSFLCSVPVFHAVLWENNTWILNFVLSLFLYLIYLYVLYDIKAMTKSDYHQTITPADSIDGAVNLQVDFITIIINFFRRICSRPCYDSN